MSSIVLPKRFYRQPQGAVQINRDNPITRGFCAAALPHGNIVRVLSSYTCNTFGVPSGTAIKNEYGTQGLGVSGRQSSNNSLRLHSVANATTTAWERPVAAGTWLACVVRYGNQANGNAPVFGNQSPDAAPYSAWAIADRSGTGTLAVECSAGGSTVNVANGSAGSFINDTPLVIVGRYNGSALQGFVNGQQFASTSCSGNLVYPNASNRGPALCNFYNYTVTSRSFNGHVYLAVLFDRALSNIEVTSISANPWQIFKVSE